MLIFFYFYIKKLYNIVILYNMDNSVNANVNQNTYFSDTSICEIIMIIFIAFLAYYILIDGNNLSSEGFASMKPSSGFEEIPQKVSFNENKLKDITAEYTPEMIDEDHPLLNEEPVKKKKTHKIRKMKRTAGINPSDLTGGDRSLLLMNENAKQNNRSYNCNLLGLNSDDMDDFKKNYYGMYAHQIECPKNCHMNKLGMKKCDLESNKDCNGVFTTEYNNPDVYSLNYMALLNNNNKPCVTCTERPMGDSTREIKNEKFATLPDEMKMKDRERVQKMKLTNANLSNTVNFEDNVYLNSIGETSVDKIAEIRTECATGTCNFKDYGKSIQNVYDNLLDTPVYNKRGVCAPYQLTGLDLSQDNYASYN